MHKKSRHSVSFNLIVNIDCEWNWWEHSPTITMISGFFWAFFVREVWRAFWHHDDCSVFSQNDPSIKRYILELFQSQIDKLEVDQIGQDKTAAEARNEIWKNGVSDRFEEWWVRGLFERLWNERRTSSRPGLEVMGLELPFNLSRILYTQTRYSIFVGTRLKAFWNLKSWLRTGIVSI